MCPNPVDPDTIAWTLVQDEDWGGGPEHTYRAENVEHADCGGDVHQVHLYDALGALLSAYTHCIKCGDDLTA